MQTTQTVDKEDEKGINYQSFLNAEDNSEVDQHTGTAQLTEFIEVDEKTRENFTDALDFEGENLKFFKAELELSEEQIYVVIRQNQLDLVRKWTGKSDITQLAGQYIPIKLLKDDIYTVHNFSTLRSKLDLTFEDVKHLHETNSIKFSSDEWVMTQLWHNYSDLMKTMQNFTSFVGLVLASISIIFLAFTQFTVGYVVFIFAWMITLGIQMYLSQKRKKPIESIINNI